MPNKLPKKTNSQEQFLPKKRAWMNLNKLPVSNIPQPPVADLKTNIMDFGMQVADLKEQDLKVVLFNGTQPMV